MNTPQKPDKTYEDENECTYLETGIDGLIKNHRASLESLLVEYNKHFKETKLKIDQLIAGDEVLTTNTGLLKDACVDTKDLVKEYVENKTSTEYDAVKAHKAAKELFATWCLLYCELVLSGKKWEYKARTSQDMVSAATDAYLQTMKGLREEIRSYFQNSSNENSSDKNSKHGSIGFKKYMADVLFKEYYKNIRGQFTKTYANGKIKKTLPENNNLIKVEKEICCIDDYIKKGFTIVSGKEYDSWIRRKQNRAKDIIIQRGNEYFILKEQNRFTSLDFENDEGEIDLNSAVAKKVITDSIRFREKYFMLKDINHALGTLYRKNKINDLELELLERVYSKGEKLAVIDRDWKERQIKDAPADIYTFHKEFLKKIQDEIDG